MWRTGEIRDTHGCNARGRIATLWGVGCRVTACHDRVGCVAVVGLKIQYCIGIVALLDPVS